MLDPRRRFMHEPLDASKFRLPPPPQMNTATWYVFLLVETSVASHNLKWFVAYGTSKPRSEGTGSGWKSSLHSTSSIRNGIVHIYTYIHVAVGAVSFYLLILYIYIYIHMYVYMYVFSRSVTQMCHVLTSFLCQLGEIPQNEAAILSWWWSMIICHFCNIYLYTGVVYIYIYPPNLTWPLNMDKLGRWMSFWGQLMAYFQELWLAVSVRKGIQCTLHSCKLTVRHGKLTILMVFTRKDRDFPWLC